MILGSKGQGLVLGYDVGRVGADLHRHRVHIPSSLSWV